MKHRIRSRKILEKILLPIAVFAAFRKTAETEDFLKTLDLTDDSAEFKKIRCPVCKWSPTAESRWFCSDCDAPEFFYGGCGNCWNTFQTRGVCPTCNHQWRWTSCLSCSAWSRHEDWYEKD